MKIVIDIDDMAYKFVQNTSFVEDESTMFEQTNADRKKTLFLFDILDAIKNGTPLPRGHGRLIDAEEVKRKMGNLDGFGMIGRCIDEFLTIIEPYKAESEDNEDIPMEYFESGGI